MPEASSETAFAELLRVQAGHCKRIGSPLYAELLRRAAADAEACGPVWELLRGHERDPADSMLALRMMGAVNRLALRGDEPALAGAYRDGGRDPEATWRAFRAALQGNAGELRRIIERPVQTNEVGRCAALLPGFLSVAAETGLPLRLLEVGASAGLNLRWDRYRYLGDGGSFSWGPADSPVQIEFELDGADRLPGPPQFEVLDREGCDAAPVDPTTAEGRLTLLAYIWPDQSVRVRRAQAALEVVAACPASIDREGAAAWVERKLADPAPGRATVLFHSIVLQYLDAAERVAFRAGIEDAARRARADAPLAWLRMEPAGEWAEVRLTTWPGGEDRHLARVGYHGSPVELAGAPPPEGRRERRDLRP